MDIQYDCVILGHGPAGLQAAIHASRKKAKVIVLGRSEASSLWRAHMENYFGVKGPVSGEELIRIGIDQVKESGAEVLEEDVVKVEQIEGDAYMVTTETKKHLTTYTIIFAMGVSRKGLGLKREKDLIGRGISYCVDCDANFFRNAKVAVVGNGSAAADGALTLSKIASEVTMITDDLNISKSLNEELESANVELIKGDKIKELIGDNALTGIRLESGRVIEVDGLFVEKGAKGAMSLAALLGVQMDPETFQYIVTDRKQRTNLPGIYAAGDITGLPFQVAKAVGEGCVAGMEAASYALKKRREQKGAQQSE